MTTTNSTSSPALDALSPDYRELVETANLDWLVAQYVYQSRRITTHSSVEIIVAAIKFVGERDYTPEVFGEAVANY